jgi:hypothetical protein
MAEQKQKQNQRQNPYVDEEPGRPSFPSTEEESEDIESGQDFRRGSQRDDDPRRDDDVSDPDKRFGK